MTKQAIKKSIDASNDQAIIEADINDTTKIQELIKNYMSVLKMHLEMQVGLM